MVGVVMLVIMLVLLSIERTRCGGHLGGGGAQADRGRDEGQQEGGEAQHVNGVIPYGGTVCWKKFCYHGQMLNDDAKSDLGNRLRRIEGQVQGLQRMVEEGRYCVDIMLQVSAVQGALTRVNSAILGSHLDTCVRHALEKGDEARKAKVVEELQVLYERHRR